MQVLSYQLFNAVGGLIGDKTDGKFASNLGRTLPEANVECRLFVHGVIIP